MGISNFYEEVLVLVLILLAVFGVYVLLRLHYHFAFGLMKNTALYEKNEFKIEKAKIYVFAALKVLLWLGLISVFIFCSLYLYDGMSLKALIFELLAKIPEGFWIEALLVLVRIMAIIVISRYLLKIAYRFLDRYQHTAIKNRCRNCEEETIVAFYAHVHNMLKYTVLLGIVYRIALFFPFLEIIHQALWTVLVLYVLSSLGVLMVRWVVMIKEKNRT
jgi:hypothetical protein